MERHQIIVANKMDMPESQKTWKEFKEEIGSQYDEFDELPQIFPISSLAHQGLDNLLETTTELLDKRQNSSCIQMKWYKKEVYYGFDNQPLTSVGDDDAAWVLSGEELELFQYDQFRSWWNGHEVLVNCVAWGLMKLFVRVEQKMAITAFGSVNLIWICELSVIPCGSKDSK